MVGSNKRNRIQIILILIFLIVLIAFSSWWLYISIKNNNDKNTDYAFVLLVISSGLFFAENINIIFHLLAKKYGKHMNAILVELYASGREYYIRTTGKEPTKSKSNVDTNYNFATIKYELDGVIYTKELKIEETTWRDLSRNKYVGKDIPILIFRKKVFFDYDDFYNKPNKKELYC